MQYPNIAQPQYGFGPTMPPGMYDTPPALMNFKKGGLASLSLPEMAEKVRAAGRGGDTVLAHITPEEAGILKLLGGSGTINPRTGQPEYLKKFIKKVVPKPIYELGSKVGKELERGVESIAKGLGPVGQIAAAYFGGPIGAALYAGLAPEGSSFDVKRAATAAALTYGAQQLSQGMGGEAAGGGGNAAGTGGPYDISDVGSLGDLGYTAPPPSVLDAVSAPASTGSFADVGEIPGVTSMPGATPQALPQPSFIDRATDYVSEIPSKIEAGIKSLPETVSNLPGQALDYAASLPGKLATYAMDNPVQAALIGTTAYGSIKSVQELEKQREEAERILREQEGKKASDIAWAQGVMRDYPINYRRLTAEDVRAQQGMAGGGLASLNAFKSGGEPRFLKGGGDGMSDDIPATIGGRQKAALSDGEFVIPADVVSHLGNGSSRAGAKKLYSMMDNIRKARTGKKRQAPEVRADRYMPA